MFKRFVVVCALLLCFLVPMSSRDREIMAASTTFSESTTYTGDIITIDESVTGNYFTVPSGVTLTLNDVTFDGSGIVSGALIKVESGGKLIVNNLNVTLNKCTYAISNYGECVIDGLNVVSTTTYDFYNSSNACTFENVSIDSMYLNDGYITVNGSTEIENTISVELSSTKETIPSLIVDGDSVFASRFNDKFVYVGDYQVEYSIPFSDEVEYFDTIFDYVGATDKFKDTSKTTVANLGLTTGDIVLSSKVCLDSNGNYIAPLYGTMNTYLKAAGSRTYSYTSDDLFDSNEIDGENVYMVADNYHMAFTKKSKITLQEESSCVGLTTKVSLNSEIKSTKTTNIGIKGSWLLFIDREAEDYTIENSENVNVTKLYDCATHIALLVDHIGNESENTTASVNVLFTEITEVTVSPVAVNSEFTYTGEDIFDDIEVVYYYGDTPYAVGVVPIEIINKGTYTLYLYSLDEGFVLDTNTLEIVVNPKELTIDYTQTSSEYTGSDITVSAELNGVVDGDIVGVSLTNNVKREIGTYTVTATIDNDNYVIADGDETYSFVISKIRINESWESPAAIECTYQASDILPNIDSILSASDAIQVDYEYTTIPRNAGEYTVYVNVSLKDTEHYESLSSEKSRFECLVIIYPVMVEPYLTCNSFEYTGEIPILELKFRYSVGGETVLGELSSFSGYNVNTYKVECSLVDNEVNKNYFIYEWDRFLNVSITPATINMNNVTFVDEDREYSGEIYVPAVANLPDTVEVTYEYENNIYELGDHTVTARFTRKDPSNYAELSTTELTMTLTITACRIDVSDVTLSGDSVDYDGDEHGLTLSNMPNNVTFSVDNNSYINAGSYEIKFRLLPINSNYTLYGRTSMEITAVLVINKINYDLSGIAFVDKETTYNAEPQTISMTGSLPTGLTTQNTVYFTNVGTHNVKLVFINSNDNYNTPADMTAVLTINPKVLTISLETNEFTYTGEPYTVESVVAGLEGDDTVIVTLTGETNTLAGNYNAHASITDNNYTLSTDTLPYVIKKAIINMSGVSLQSKEVYYFGGVYTPEITGTLPTGITSVVYTHEEIKNVGEYDVVAAFVVDSNYHTPAQLLATIEIIHKPITISFSNHLNLMYNGETQYITVTVAGMVDNEEYTISYSGEPKEPGEYCCEVVLAYDTNYEAMSDTKCYFNIHTATKTYTGEKYNLTVSDGMFKVDNELSVNKITLSKEVESQIKTMHQEMVYMDSIKIIADHSEEEISVSLELKELNLAKNKALTLYKLTNDGKLVKVEYTVVGNTLRFSSLPNTNYVIVSDEVDNSIMILLIVIAGLFIVASSFSIVMVVKNKKLKKAKKNK